MGRPSNASKQVAFGENTNPTSGIRARVNADEYAAEIRRTRTSDISQVRFNLPIFVDNQGWKRRWVHEDNCITRRNQGYRYVTKDEIGGVYYDDARESTDASNYVAYPAKGRNDHGKPTMMYLMEIPKSLARELDHELNEKDAIEYQDGIRNSQTKNQDAQLTAASRNFGVESAITYSNL
jgi:hypothetical protein